jgi:LmbE family N-acetylglucosaminyl deacetylase
MRVSPLRRAAALPACICLASVAGADALPPIDSATTLLVVSPHPDDETLCCGAVIQRVLQAGGRASIVWITSGDASRLTLLFNGPTLLPDQAHALAMGERRMAEARAATARLGVTQAGQLFLGYPDGGLAQLLTTHERSAYTSPLTAQAAVPYAAALFPGHAYTGVNLERDFAAVLARVRPTLILAPSPLDEHSDHSATGLLTIAAAGRAGLSGRVRYWIVHGGNGWPSPRGLLPGVPLTPAPRGGSLTALPFAVTPAEEDRKAQALGAYETQMRDMSPFLLAFVRSTELFSPQPQ